MKTLTKEKVYVVIDNQSDCDRAIEILTKAGEPMWDDEIAFRFDKVERYLCFYDEEWLIDKIKGDKTQVTLDELESLLKPKIKESELLNRIESLEKKVAELEENTRVAVEVEQPHRDVFSGPSQKIKFPNPAEKPQFEVGKVYKRNSIFYCTKSGDCETLEAFGFNYKGHWEESINLEGSDFSDFTEATPEEWFNRLEEEAKKRGYVKGVEVNNIHMSYTQKIDGKLEIWNQGRSLAVVGLFGLIMDNGKWAEIIEEPQYKIGTIGIFWDGDLEEQMSRGNVLFGELDHITEDGHFRRKGKSWSWYNFKPIKID